MQKHFCSAKNDRNASSAGKFMAITYLFSADLLLYRLRNSTVEAGETSLRGQIFVIAENNKRHLKPFIQLHKSGQKSQSFRHIKKRWPFHKTAEGSIFEKKSLRFLDCSQRIASRKLQRMSPKSEFLDFCQVPASRRLNPLQNSLLIAQNKWKQAQNKRVTP